MKQAEYYSPEFYKILEVINEVLERYRLTPISANKGKVSQSKFNTGNYGNKYMWRITNKEYQNLLNSQLMFDIKKILTANFPQYINSKIITIGNPLYTKNFQNQPMASIVIMITELQDNIITKNDLMLFESGNSEAIKKCLEIESRMFRRDNDLRDAKTRIEDFAYSMIYEPKLINTTLSGITNLELKHQTDVVTLETDNNTDFIGIINNNNYKIEGKSTKAIIDYADNYSDSFATYISKRLSDGSLGSIHDADYVLLVLKQTGDVICFNAKSPKENWLAGRIIL